MKTFIIATAIAISVLMLSLGHAHAGIVACINRSTGAIRQSFGATSCPGDCTQNEPGRQETCTLLGQPAQLSYHYVCEKREHVWSWSLITSMCPDGSFATGCSIWSDQKTQAVDRAPYFCSDAAGDPTYGNPARGCAAYPPFGQDSIVCAACLGQQ